MSAVCVRVRVQRTQDGQALAVLNGGPFNGAVLTPHQMKYLAASLAGTADAIAEEDVNAPDWRPRSFRMGDVMGSLAPALYVTEGAAA